MVTYPLQRQIKKRWKLDHQKYKSLLHVNLTCQLATTNWTKDQLEGKGQWLVYQQVTFWLAEKDQALFGISWKWLLNGHC